MEGTMNFLAIRVEKVYLSHVWNERSWKKKSIQCYYLFYYIIITLIFFPLNIIQFLLKYLIRLIEILINIQICNKKKIKLN